MKKGCPEGTLFHEHFYRNNYERSFSMAEQK